MGQNSTLSKVVNVYGAVKFAYVAYRSVRTTITWWINSYCSCAKNEWSNCTVKYSALTVVCTNAGFWVRIDLMA